MDKVVLDYGGGRSADLASPPFRFHAGSAFEGTIAIHKSGHHEWKFPIRVSEAKGSLSFRFHEKTRSTPAMASVTSVSASAAAKKDKGYFCDFTFGGCKEVVLVSGFDYHGGCANIAYATTHMHELWRAKSIDADTLVTVFDCDTGMLERWVKGVGKERLSKHKFSSGWCLLETVLQGTVPPLLQRGGGDPGTGALLISNGTWNWMYMPDSQFEYKAGNRVVKKVYYLKELNYMESELGWNFSPDWYMEYK